MDIYVKKFWDEEHTVFFIHFQNRAAIRQIEISPDRSIKLDTQTPTSGESFLCDQNLDDLDLVTGDYISAEEFEDAWKNAG